MSSKDEEKVDGVQLDIGVEEPRDLSPEEYPDAVKLYYANQGFPPAGSCRWLNSNQVIDKEGKVTAYKLWCNCQQCPAFKLQVTDEYCKACKFHEDRPA